MARIRHIAIQTQDEEATKRFYVENFGLEVVRKLDSSRTSGYYLTDGHINLAILRFKNDAIAGPERGKGWSGIHHIGFQVDSLDEMVAKLEQSGVAKPRDDINVALGLGAGGAPAGHGNVECATSVPTMSTSTSRKRAGSERPATRLTTKRARRSLRFKTGSEYEYSGLNGFGVCVLQPVSRRCHCEAQRVSRRGNLVAHVTEVTASADA